VSGLGRSLGCFNQRLAPGARPVDEVGQHRTHLGAETLDIGIGIRLDAASQGVPGGLLLLEIAMLVSTNAACADGCCSPCKNERWVGVKSMLM